MKRSAFREVGSPRLRMGTSAIDRSEHAVVVWPLDGFQLVAGQALSPALLRFSPEAVQLADESHLAERFLVPNLGRSVDLSLIHI